MDEPSSIQPGPVSGGRVADPLGLRWLAGREEAAISLSSKCSTVAGQARRLGLDALADTLDQEADVLDGEASVCRGEMIRAGHPVDQGACDPEEACCDDWAAEYAAPEEIV